MLRVSRIRGLLIWICAHQRKSAAVCFWLNAECYLLLHNRVIAIARQSSAHRLSVFLFAERPNLHVEQRITGRVGDKDRILLLAQRCHQNLCIFLF